MISMSLQIHLPKESVLVVTLLSFHVDTVWEPSGPQLVSVSIWINHRPYIILKIKIIKMIHYILVPFFNCPIDLAIHVANRRLTIGSGCVMFSIKAVSR